MTSSVTVKTIYSCSLERAFKAPMLCVFSIADNSSRCAKRPKFQLYFKYYSLAQ